MNAVETVEAVVAEQLRPDVADVNFSVGDTINVHYKIIEGDKERIQVYEGVVIVRKRKGLQSTFTVRKVSYGVGVERVFPLHSPMIAKIDVKSRGLVRRSRLFYLRQRSGKAARIARIPSKCSFKPTTPTVNEAPWLLAISHWLMNVSKSH